MSSIISLPNGSSYDNDKLLVEQSEGAKTWIDEAYELGEKRGISWVNLKPYYSSIGYQNLVLNISKPGQITIEEDATQF